MRRLRETIAKAAPANATVLIVGESGTGKELVARALHRQSARSQQAPDPGELRAIPEELIESELFGHEKGSFTGAVRKQAGKFVLADTGTIFLDEIGDMSARTQAKVLRVLQSGEVEPVGAQQIAEVDVRVIAATNRNLEEEMAEGRFREDLFYRLNVIPIQTPPCGSISRISPSWWTISCGAMRLSTTAGRRSFRRSDRFPARSALEGQRSGIEECDREGLDPQLGVGDYREGAGQSVGGGRRDLTSVVATAQTLKEFREASGALLLDRATGSPRVECDAYRTVDRHSP